MPPRLIPYWNAFIDLSKRRDKTETGYPKPIKYQEMQSYISLKFNREAPQVRRLLLFVEALDDAYLADFSEKQ